MSKYTMDMEIEFGLSIGFPTARREETNNLGELLGVDADEFAIMSDDEIEKQLDSILADWADNYIDKNWSLV